MPAIVDKYTISDPFLDRRTKLIPCQREMVKYWYDQGHSINSIAKLFKVNKRLIQFTLFPERHKKNLEDRRDRGGSKIYYDSDVNTITQRNHRKYKQKLFTT